MTELKTLQDLQKVLIKDIGWGSRTSIPVSELRQEANKFLDNETDLSEFWKWCRKVKGFDHYDKEKYPLDFILAFIEWFFNIKAEALN